ncbi:hypothetical protein BN946_scf184585.g12 [Trametes cinnabarina]|uniref:Multifunctional tryptophan biosynthesis protein n=1 Tax=Pycnoporus cinnabarinus TaxID=5643 RepID=A0A060STZ9_PYCCI|nr:hypothetical protein BN946_scf184585.g12 [Trametes cinnabarina]
MALVLPAELARPLDVLLIDNFDSFTWNIYQSLCLLGADVTVIRNDAISPAAFPLLKLNSLIILPRPRPPHHRLRHLARGHQCLVDVFGGHIGYAGEIMHGKVSAIRHDGRGCFKDIPQGIKSTRYHSLSASTSTLPPDLAITSITEDSGVIMGFRVNDESLPPFGIEGIASAVNGQASGSGKVPTILDKIYAQRMKDVEAAKRQPGTTPADLETLLSLSLAPAPISFVQRLKQTPKKPALMAEIKRASPSKGPIAMSANAAQQALTYALAGASVISVLTEPTWFKGSLLDMRLARQAVDALPHRPAILRKDFIFDEYQIAEARLHGADSVLLIVAMLPVPRLHALYEYAKSLGIEPLVEVNNAREMEAALALGAKVIGVNNRNLHDFQVDMSTTSRLADMVRERDVILCALSGIQSSQDVRTYTEQGVGAVLGSANGLSGGTGSRIDLDLARSVVEKGEVGDGERMPIILAGGLTPDNVKEVVATVRPWAVDVSGGVEKADGSGKDAEKVKAFISAAKSV